MVANGATRSATLQVTIAVAISVLQLAGLWTRGFND